MAATSLKDLEDAAAVIFVGPLRKWRVFVPFFSPVSLARSAVGAASSCVALVVTFPVTARRRPPGRPVLGLSRILRASGGPTFVRLFRGASV